MMGLDVRGRIIVGFRKEDIFRKREVVIQVKKFDENTGIPRFVEEKTYAEELLLEGIWTVFSEEKLEGLGFLFYVSDYESTDNIIIGVEINSTVDLRGDTHTAIISLDEIISVKAKVADFFKQEPQIYNQLNLSY
jgi:hypothetical protein